SRSHLRAREADTERSYADRAAIRSRSVGAQIILEDDAESSSGPTGVARNVTNVEREAGSSGVRPNESDGRGARLTSHGRARSAAVVATAATAAALPLVGLASLLLRSHLDPHLENYRLHFVVFGFVGAVAFALGHMAGHA